MSSGSFKAWGDQVKFWHDKMTAAFQKSVDDGSSYEFSSFDAGYTAGVQDAAPLVSEPAVQPEQPQDQFCDANCTWRDHHPECVRAAPAVLPLLPEDREALSPPSMDGAVQAATSGGER